MVQAVELLLCKHKVLSSNLSVTKKKEYILLNSSHEANEALIQKKRDNESMREKLQANFINIDANILNNI
jgi:hypothetical protein